MDDRNGYMLRGRLARRGYKIMKGQYVKVDDFNGEYGGAEYSKNDK